MMNYFNGLNINIGNLYRLSQAKTFSISPENFTGEKGKGGMAADGTGAQCARELGIGWKISPSVEISPGETFTIARIIGLGSIQSIWFGGAVVRDQGRLAILRFYWDDQEQPSVECPLGDFFTLGWRGYAQNNSIPVSANPNRGLNCFWQMPFRKNCRISLENLTDEKLSLYYQVNYTLTEVPEDAAYFHAQFRRVNPLPYKSDYIVLDGVRGAGQYVGTYLAVGVTNNNWWGEGEFKFFLDGDSQSPTICGTGTEDYFGGAWCFFKDGKSGPEQVFNTPYCGLPLACVDDPQGPRRFSLYRWHLLDSIGFSEDLRVTIQALGWWPDGKYEPLTDDIASVAYWYQCEPHAPFPKFPSVRERWGR